MRRVARGLVVLKIAVGCLYGASPAAAGPASAACCARH